MTDTEQVSVWVKQVGGWRNHSTSGLKGREERVDVRTEGQKLGAEKEP